jgi:sigma-B regulation protein RsbU (phosphoserine phosphatase)
VFAFVVSLGYGVVGTVFRQEAELVGVQRELETARRIQTALLPRDLPRVSGLDVAVRYLPMTAVAGDLYDFLDLGPSHLGILVADVCGHGIPAALVASMVKVAFSAQAEQAHDPAQVLSAINRILCRHVDGTFVTAIYAVIDTHRRTITVANAGHPPLLVGRADRGGVVESGARGMVLGVFPDAPYVNSELALAPGDAVLVYTDGIPETTGPQGEFLDLERVKGWLGAIDRHTASQFADAALRQLREWRGGTAFDDDITLVVARFSESATLV